MSHSRNIDVILVTRRGTLALSLVLASAFAAAAVRMYVNVQGKRVGQAVASQKLLPDGSKLVQLSMQLAGPNKATVTLRSESTYNSKGAPVRMFHETLAANPRSRRAVTVTFSKAGANVVEEVDGKRTTKTVTLATGAPMESKSEFWFVRDKPKAGATDKRYRFDISKLTWELTTTTYVGKKTVNAGGKSYAAHEVHSANGIAFVDDEGLPVKLTIDQISLERVPAP